jgi:hypothetical protein
VNLIIHWTRQLVSRGNIFAPFWRAAVGLGSFVLAMTALSITGHAQQTVFNVPTTDVLDKGKVYFELDVSAKPNNSDALNKFSSFVPRLVVGAGNRVEVGFEYPRQHSTGTRFDRALACCQMESL